VKAKLFLKKNGCYVVAHGAGVATSASLARSLCVDMRNVLN